MLEYVDEPSQAGIKVQRERGVVKLDRETRHRQKKWVWSGRDGLLEDGKDCYLVFGGGEACFWDRQDGSDGAGTAGEPQRKTRQCPTFPRDCTSLTTYLPLRTQFTVHYLFTFFPLLSFPVTSLLHQVL